MQIPHRYHITSAEQNRRMDSKTINEFGIDGFTLMEIAGTRAADYIMQHSETGSKVLLVCGKGNNAGDAFVVGRILSQQGYNCSYFLCFGDEDLSSDAQKNYELLLKLDSDLPIITELSELDTRNYDVIVDGIFGTGLTSEVRSPIDTYIGFINASNAQIFALDIPSGLSSDTGRIMGAVVRAHHTLSFGALKAGSFLNEGKEICGEVILCDLPFPNEYREHAGYLIDEDWVELNSIPKKQREHKYAEGMLYIIAGSEGLTGAAILAAKSAWAQELGAVTVITPKALLDIYEKTLIQIIKKPVGNSSETHFTSKHLDDVLEILQQKKGTILIGPGLGRESETLEFVRSLLKQYDGNAVIDADALFALDETTIQQKPANTQWILTPHPGELSRILTDSNSLDDDFNRMIQVSAFAKKHNITILSKGYPGILASKNGEAFLTTYDSRIFARAGFGDVLAGKIGAFWLTEQNEIIASSKALLQGYQKARLVLEMGKNAPEPLDII
jgi:NAD(P)H-hydrate epimerase